MIRAATLIETPMAGRILRIRRDTAGPVAAGTPLVEIGNISSLEIVADPLTADAMRVPTSAAATVTDWGGPRPIAARARRVEPAAFTKISALGLEEQRVRVVLDLTELPPAGLGHDFSHERFDRRLERRECAHDPVYGVVPVRQSMGGVHRSGRSSPADAGDPGPGRQYQDGCRTRALRGGRGGCPTVRRPARRRARRAGPPDHAGGAMTSGTEPKRRGAQWIRRLRWCKPT